jgi:hypothetical protein
LQSVQRSFSIHHPTPPSTMSAPGGGPNLNAWKALLDFSTRHTDPEPNPDVKPLSKGVMPFFHLNFVCVFLPPSSPLVMQKMRAS